MVDILVLEEAIDDDELLETLLLEEVFGALVSVEVLTTTTIVEVCWVEDEELEEVGMELVELTVMTEVVEELVELTGVETSVDDSEEEGEPPQAVRNGNNSRYLFMREISF